MIAILTAIFGFAAPFLPTLLKLFTQRQDNAHELKMTELRMRGAAQEHMHRLEEINAQADIAETQQLYQPTPSYGVQMIDAAQQWQMGRWVLVPAFYIFATLDFLSGMVRPAITYAAFGGYLAYKAALFFTLTGPRFEASAASAVMQMWTDQDWGVLTLVISYWFGLRHYKAVYGGNASHGKPGA
jgi:hypothetical protein